MMHAALLFKRNLYISSWRIINVFFPRILKRKELVCAIQKGFLDWDRYFYRGSIATRENDVIFDLQASAKLLGELGMVGYINSIGPDDDPIPFF